ncbi:hypothetical protein [Amycolatopsis sp. NPDC059657]|uniref:hypothetical protein n=1 Tax=Amycolatopsis sp. NPDC059657 TaxID=3346899 RepID=UPI0036702766
MVKLQMAGAFVDGWFEGTSHGPGEELDTADRELPWKVYEQAPSRRYGRGCALLLTFPETRDGLDALDTLFDSATVGVIATADNPEDRGTQVACRQMVDQTLVAIRELEARLCIEPGQLTYLGIRR